MPDRIVSVTSLSFIHPIVRGKAGKPVKLGEKLDIRVVDRRTRLECYSLVAYSEAGAAGKVSEMRGRLPQPHSGGQDIQKP